MGALIVILSLGVIGTLMYSVFVTRELNEERSRRYEAEEWIDPIAVEEIDERTGRL